jgi:hypothetical protein
MSPDTLLVLYQDNETDPDHPLLRASVISRSGISAVVAETGAGPSDTEAECLARAAPFAEMLNELVRNPQWDVLNQRMALADTICVLAYCGNLDEALAAPGLIVSTVDGHIGIGSLNERSVERLQREINDGTVMLFDAESQAAQERQEREEAAARGEPTRFDAFKERLEATVH